MRLFFGVVVASWLSAMSAAEADHGCCGYDVVCQERQIVCRQPVCVTKYRQVDVTCYKPVYEDATVRLTYKICKPVTEMVPQTVVSYVCKPVYEDVEMQFCNVVRKPVVVRKQIQVDCGRFETVCTTDACGRCCYKKVWCPRIETREVAYQTCTYERQVITKTVRLCKTVREEVTKEVMVPVCRMTYETAERDVPIKKCRMEPYVVTRNVPYTEVTYVDVVKTIRERVCVPRACVHDSCEPDAGVSHY